MGIVFQDTAKTLFFLTYTQWGGDRFSHVESLSWTCKKLHHLLTLWCVCSYMEFQIIYVQYSFMDPHVT